MFFYSLNNILFKFGGIGAANALYYNIFLLLILFEKIKSRNYEIKVGFDEKMKTVKSLKVMNYLAMLFVCRVFIFVLGAYCVLRYSLVFPYFSYLILEPISLGIFVLPFSNLLIFSPFFSFLF